MSLRKRQRMMQCFRSQGALQHSKRMWTAELVNRWCCLASAKRDKVRRTRFSVSGALTPPFAWEAEGVMFRAWRAWTYDGFRAYA